MLNRYSRVFGNGTVLNRIGLLAVFFVLLFLRRSAQLLHPQIWAEDGNLIIPDFLRYGWKSFAVPVNGYLNTSAKLIMGFSLLLSSVYSPGISTVLVWLFIIGVCSAIVFCPTWLPARPWIAIATLLVPCDPEVFGIPLCAFWWASLLLFLVVLWEEESPDFKWRIAFVLLGGLSSPIIFLVTPFLVIRLLVLKHKRREGAFLGVAVLCCLIQGLMLHLSAAKGNMSLSMLRLILPKFLGSYVVGNLQHATDKLLWFGAGLVLAFVLATLPFVGRQRKYWFLLGLWLGTMLFSAARVNLAEMDPRMAGPRYFFFPFVLLSWFVVSVLAECATKPLKLACAAVLAASAVNALPVLSRNNTNFRWADHLVSSSHFAQYQIPLPSDGYVPWYLFLDRAQAQKLQRWGLINARSRLAPKKTFPYRIVSIDPSALASLRATDGHLASASSVINNGWSGKDYGSSEFPGFTVIGSRRTGDADEGTFSIHLHRGDQVLFRTGFIITHQRISIQNVSGFFDYAPAAPDWVMLEFSNDLLPDEFTVVLSDYGDSWSEWSAIALRSSP